MTILRILPFLVLAAAPAGAEGVSILDGTLSAPRDAVLLARNDAAQDGPSLFAGRATTGLFAPMEPRTSRMSRDGGYPPLRGTAVERIRGLIQRAESHHEGYDAVQYGARTKPGRPPTQMTLREIFDWIAATPGQPHAIGRYQFIPSTLRRVVAATGTPESATFSPAVQDRLADVLLHEAGMADAMGGQMSRHAFMNNLAKIWAGLPNSSGRSHYHGHAGNRASMSWASFDAEMARILPG